MRIAVSHETTYRYESEVLYSVQYLRLSPRSGRRQRVLSWKIEAPGALRPWVDAFGNDTHVLVLARPHDEICVRARGEVDVSEEAGAVEELGPQRLDVYLRQTSLTEPDRDVAAFAAEFRQKVHDDRNEGLLALMNALRERIEYKAGITQVSSHASEVFARKAGVCQDHAHLFISCCRLLDVPARYVSGYVAPREDRPAASHAWAEAWIDREGWCGFDVSNGVVPAGRHIRMAVGLDYLDASPIRGFRKGGSGESMAVDVRVRDAQRPGSGFPPVVEQQQQQQQ